MTKVSVIIPAYNSMAYLPETIENVLQQTYEDFEVIVVNDGSTDETEQWVSSLNHPKIKLVSQANQGLAGARNTGITNATGEFLAFLDADDLWEATKLEKQVRALEENPEAGLVYTWVNYVNEQNIPTGQIFQHHDRGDVWRKLTEHNIVESGSVAMVRRQCLEKCGVFDRNLGSYVEDWDLWLRIARYYHFEVIKEPLVRYRQSSNSASRNWDGMLRSFEIVLEKAFADVPTELQYLKNRSYGFIYLGLAWKPLQSVNKDYQKAAYFRDKALSYYPQLRLNKQYWRVSLAIAAMQLLGKDTYQNIIPLFHNFRRLIVSVNLSEQHHK